MAKRASSDGGPKLLTHDELRAMQRELAKDLGADLVWGNDVALELRKLPLGLATFDAALDGGFAFDRVTVLVGEFSTGKTLLAMLALRAAQQRGLSVAFIDVEKTWTPQWAAQLGIDPEKVLVLRPRTGEAAFGALIALVRRQVGVVVMDSLAALSAEAELAPDEDELFEKQFIGVQARLIGRGLRLLEAENRGTLVICINQLRMAVGGYGNPETMPGGKAPSFYAWQLVRVRRGTFIEEGTGDNKRRLGYHLRIRVEKNKQGAPFKEASIPFYYTGELDELAGLVELAIERGVIRAEPPNYYIGERKLYGRPRLLAAVKDDAALRAEVERGVSAVAEADF